ncbi:MAG: tetratricopeptide repeat protein [Oscillospiraceae bacterium]|nr:tetratricopeptide repeat protein [Oscillospiraceae bacterium]
MQKNFYEQLDCLYVSQPQSVEAFLQETLAQCLREQDSEGIIAASNELGGFFRGQAQYEDSLRCFQEALERMEAMGLTGSTPYLTALLNRAGTLRLTGCAEDAVSDFCRVLALLKGDSADTRYIRASALNNLGLACQDLERLEEAENYTKQALDIIRTLPGMEAEIASSGNNLASLCLRQGRLEEAGRWLDEAMLYYESPAGTHDPHLANAYTTLAALRCRQDRLEDALAYYAQAASATERFFGKNQNYTAILHDAALVSQALERKEEAL